LPGLLQVLQVDDLKLSEIGPKFELHEMFPARTNTGNSFIYCVAICFCLYIHAVEFHLSNFLCRICTGFV
jgi:hypothetical protein